MTPQTVLDFWFAESTQSAQSAQARVGIWFGKHFNFDRAIDRDFSALPARALNGELSAWQQDARRALAVVLALDQFPRNLYRAAPQAFAFDAAARAATEAAIARGFETALHPLEATFLFLPFEHAEDLAYQDLCREGYLRQRARGARMAQPVRWFPAGRR